MKIRSHLGISTDGYISGPDGIPAQAKMPRLCPASRTVTRVHQWQRRRRYGPDELPARPRVTQLAVAGLQVFVLTSSPLPPEAPSDVVTASSPEAMLDRMRQEDFIGDVHLVDGQRTVQTFLQTGTVNSLGLVVLPFLLGDGTRLLTPGTQPADTAGIHPLLP
ncbi:MAG TPA: dihydrofolate reductase family protein [Trebonia sp.]